MWQELSDEEKKPYYQLYKEDKERYEKQMKEMGLENFITSDKSKSTNLVLESKDLPEGAVTVIKK